MLKLSRAQFEQIVAHGLEGKPLEICGFLAGRSIPEGGVVVEVFPIESDDKSEMTYVMNPLQQMRAEKEIRIKGLEVLGVYHTHPSTEPYPSKTDVARAHWNESNDLMFPEYSYLIVSLRNPHAPELRTFKIRGRIIPDDIEEVAVVIEG